MLVDIAQVADVLKGLAERRGPEGCTSGGELAGALKDRYPHLTEERAQRWAERVAERARSELSDVDEDPEEGEFEGRTPSAGDREGSSRERLKGMEQTLAEGRERMQRIEALLASLLAASGGGGGGGRRAPVAAR
eukprot:tig00021537_g22328.t1